MHELLASLLSLILEILLELGGELVLDVLARSAGDAFKSDHPPHPAATWVGCLFLGVLVGGVSVVVLPRPLFHSSHFHGISLLVAPILTGCVMSAIGRLLRQRGKRVLLIETFPYAFALALGMALVRYLHAPGISLVG